MQWFQSFFHLHNIIEILVRVAIIFTVLPVHEWAHAYIAYKLGDNTAKNMGRLTLNPVASFDPIGSLLLVLFGFGWAKPVPINPNNFRNPRGGMAISALAGPISNLIMAIIGVFVANICTVLPYNNVVLTIFYIAQYFASINISLAVFNLIPVPPLDGSRVLSYFLPRNAAYKLQYYERYIGLALMLVVATGALGGFVGTVSSFIYKGINTFVGLPFKFLR